MATKTRKTAVIKNKSAAPTAKRRRPARTARRGAQSSNAAANFFLPLFFIFCILFCLGFLGFMGYRTVTASEFFDVKKIDVRGASRASRDDIEKIVAANTEKSGVWNADLKEIKLRVEKLQFVKTAAVSRVLPDGVRVNVVERVPRAIVRFPAGDFWVDEEATILALVGKNEQRFPFVLAGWDEAKTDKAIKDNQERIRIYQKMLDEWRQFELDKRVQSVDLQDPKNPQVETQVNGVVKKIILPKDDFAKKLKQGLEYLASGGEPFPGVDVREVQPHWLPYQQKKEN